MTTHSLTKAELAQFTGTSTYYSHPLAFHIRCTDGVYYIAEKGKAYWLLDLIVYSQAKADVRCESFQVWTLIVGSDRAAQLVCEDGNGHMVFKQDIEYTDFPLDEIQFYFTDNVILLPSEY